MGILGKKKKDDTTANINVTKSKLAQLPPSGLDSGDASKDANDDMDEELVVYADDLTISKYISKAWSGDPREQAKSAKCLGTLAMTEDYQLRIASEGGLHPLLSLIKSKDRFVQLHASYAISNITLHPNNRMKVIEDGGLASVIPLTRSPDPRIVQHGAAILRNLAANEEARKFILKDGALQPLLGLLKSTEVDSRNLSAECLALLCQSVDNIALLVKAGALRNFSSLILDNDETLAMYMALIMDKVSAFEQYHPKLVQESCFRNIVELTKNAEILETRRFCANTINYCTMKSDVNRQTVLKLGGIIPLMYWATEDDDMNLREAAINCLKNVFGTSDENDVSILSGMEIRLIIQLIETGVTEFLPRAAAAIADLAEEEFNRQSIVEDGGVEQLIKLIARPNRLGSMVINLAKQHATRAIANIASSEELQDHIINSNGIRPLLDLLSSPDSKLLLQATTAIANLSSHVAMEDALISSEDILRKLVQLMTSSDIDVARSVCCAISNLSESSKHVEHVIAAGAVRAFIQGSALGNDGDSGDTNGQESPENDIREFCIAGLFHIFTYDGLRSFMVAVTEAESDGDDELGHSAALSLVNMCMDDDSRFLIVKQGGLRLLFKLAESPIISEQFLFASTLAELTENDKNRIRIVLEGGLSALLLLSQSRDKDTAVEAARAVRNLCVKEQLKSTIVQGGGLLLCRNFGENEATEVLLFAAYSYDLLSTKTDVQYRMVEDEKSLKVLFSLAQNSDKEVQFHACSAIANLSSNEECRTILVMRGNLRPLLDLARSRNETAQLKAAMSLSNLAEDASLRELLIRENVIEPMISMTRKDDSPTVQMEAARGLALLAEENETQLLIVKKGGLPPLIAMALSSNEGLQTAGVRALSQLAFNSRNRMEIIEAGGVAPLQMVARSNKKSDLKRFAAMAVGFLQDDQDELKVLATEMRKQDLEYLNLEKIKEKLEDELDQSESDKYALAGEIDKMRNRMYDVMRQSALRKLRAVMDRWTTQAVNGAFTHWKGSLNVIKREQARQLLDREINEMKNSMNLAKQQWEEDIQRRENEKYNILKTQAVARMQSISHQWRIQSLFHCLTKWKIYISQYSFEKSHSKKNEIFKKHEEVKKKLKSTKINSPESYKLQEELDQLNMILGLTSGGDFSKLDTGSVRSFSSSQRGLAIDITATENYEKEIISLKRQLEIEKQRNVLLASEKQETVSFAQNLRLKHIFSTYFENSNVVLSSAFQIWRSFIETNKLLKSKGLDDISKLLRDGSQSKDRRVKTMVEALEVVIEDRDMLWEELKGITVSVKEIENDRNKLAAEAEQLRLLTLKLEADKSDMISKLNEVTSVFEVALEGYYDI